MERIKVDAFIKIKVFLGDVIVMIKIIY